MLKSLLATFVWGIIIGMSEKGIYSSIMKFPKLILCFSAQPHAVLVSKPGLPVVYHQKTRTFTSAVPLLLPRNGRVTETIRDTRIRFVKGEERGRAKRIIPSSVHCLKSRRIAELADSGGSVVKHARSINFWT